MSAQSDIIKEEPEPAETAPSEQDFEPLPKGYSGIELGMGIETVKTMLLDNPNFSYRGEPDVSMSPAEKQTVIDCDGVLYVKRGYFQFEDDKLYLITMVMDPEYIDHYSIYTALVKKYGQPDALNPQKTVWDDGEVRVSLERPLSLKYIDMEVFRKIRDESFAEESIESQLRQDFLEAF